LLVLVVFQTYGLIEDDHMNQGGHKSVSTKNVVPMLFRRIQIISAHVMKIVTYASKTSNVNWKINRTTVI
jgi:hypothetical protein